MKNLNPTTAEFPIANYNWCKYIGIYNDSLRVLIPLSKESEAKKLLSKFPKYCKVELGQTRTSNDQNGHLCFMLTAQYYNRKCYMSETKKPNKAAEKRRVKIMEILEENNIKSF